MKYGSWLYPPMSGHVHVALQVCVSVHAHTHPHTLPPVLLTGIGAVTISGENTSAINSRFCEDYTLNNYH